MRIILIGIALMFVIPLNAALAQDAEVATPEPMLLAPSDIQWGDPPPVLEKGASFAVVSGDPSAPGIFVIRLQVPAGYKVAPHWHPTDENVTILSGTVGFGLGESFDEAALKELSAGSYVSLPAESRHYVSAKTAAMIQIEGPGPFGMYYVNPDDDPRQRTAAQ